MRFTNPEHQAEYDAPVVEQRLKQFMAEAEELVKALEERKKSGGLTLDECFEIETALKTIRDVLA
jgi:hypothetical protein